MTSFRFLRSGLADAIYKFVNFKRSTGIAYKTEVNVLSNFDAYVYENFPFAHNLSKEIVLKWSEKSPNENDSNRKRRISVIRQFAKFLQESDEEAWVLPAGFTPYPKKYVPYIFSAKEVMSLLEYVDSLPFLAFVPDRNKIYPLFFRLLICCGMRLGEVMNLRVSDVDTTNSVIKIRKSKSGKPRLVPFNSYLLWQIEDYKNKCCSERSGESFLFSYTNGKKGVSAYPAHCIFREALSYAHIEYLGPGRGPRIHDLRHTFVVLRLKLWMDKKIDLASKLPYLWHYLGHKSYYEMSYYFHLVSEMWPGLIRKTEEKYPDVIPNIEFCCTPEVEE